MDARDVPPELARAMREFDEALDAWISSGDEDRLAEFAPLVEWQVVKELMAGRSIDRAREGAGGVARLQRVLAQLLLRKRA